MSIRVIHSDEGSVMYCPVSMTAFGPVFNAEEDPDEFLEWLGEYYQRRGAPSTDARQLPVTRLVELVQEWRRQPAAQTVSTERLHELQRGGA